jgi:hypothetical protein
MKPKKQMLLSYNNALTAVFLRTLAWEIHVAKRNPTVKELAANQVQSARQDLGLKPNLLSPGRTPPRPIEKAWAARNAWRLLYAPSHRAVRAYSHYPVVSKANGIGPAELRHTFTLRSPASPPLAITIGQGRPNTTGLQAHKGVYFLREKRSLYIGQSEEFQVRWRGHISARHFKWWVFVAPQDHQSIIGLDSLYAAESLLISFWNEICAVSNRTRGRDTKPTPLFLQQAAIFAEAASAAIIWLIRERKDLGFDSWTLPFKPCAARGWPKCYSGQKDLTQPGTAQDYIATTR